MTLEIAGLEFSYGSRKILHDVNLEIGDNDFVSILGPNGVGKTTLLKCICHLQKPDSGTIVVNGVDSSTITTRDLAKIVSYVPQHSYSSFTTVYDTVLLGRKPHVRWSISNADIDIAWKVIKLFHMEDYALKYTDEISGGELQKVNIARAVAQNADIMILDEPTNNLDISNQHMIMYLLTQLVQKRGMCVIMTMHDINIALRYSNRFIFVKDGRVVASGGREVVTEGIIKEVFNVDVNIIENEGCPYVIPRNAQDSFGEISAEDIDELSKEMSLAQAEDDH